MGSGVFFGLTLLVVFPLKAHKVVGTDIFHAAILLYVAGAAHWAAGNVDFSHPRLAAARLDPGRPHRRQAHALDPGAHPPAHARGGARARGRQAPRRPGRGDDRDRRVGGGRGGAPRLDRPSQLDPHPARTQRRRSPTSDEIASPPGDAHGLGQLRHGRPRLPRGRRGRRGRDRGSRDPARPGRPAPLGAVLVRRDLGRARRSA